MRVDAEEQGDLLDDDVVDDDRVVEAALRSGALNTASWAQGLGRVVMGVPGPVTSAP